MGLEGQWIGLAQWEFLFGFLSCLPWFQIGFQAVHRLKEKRIEEILEPILISLLIGGLENHSARDFVLEKLTHIQNVGLDAVTWKTFIPGNYKKTKNDRNCLNIFLVILSPSCA